MLSKKKQQKNKKILVWTNLNPSNAFSQQQNVVRRLSMAGSLSTGAGGGVGTRFLSSSVNTATEWSSLAAVYTQARVVEMRVHYVPTVPLTTGVSQSGVFGTDRSGSLAIPATLSACWALNNPKVFVGAMVKPAVYTARAIDLEDQDFDPVTAMTARYAIQLFVQNGPTSALVGNYLIEFAVEFKGAQ